MATTARFQIGKNALTENFIETIKSAFKNHRQVRLSVLKSAPRRKSDIESYAKEIQTKLSFKTRFRIIGFTIVLSK